MFSCCCFGVRSAAVVVLLLFVFWCLLLIGVCFCLCYDVVDIFICVCVFCFCFCRRGCCFCLCCCCCDLCSEIRHAETWVLKERGRPKVGRTSGWNWEGQFSWQVCKILTCRFQFWGCFGVGFKNRYKHWGLSSDFGLMFFQFCVKTWVDSWAMAGFTSGPRLCLHKRGCSWLSYKASSYIFNVACFFLCLSRCALLLCSKQFCCWCWGFGGTLGPLVNSATPKHGPNTESTVCAYIYTHTTSCCYVYMDNFMISGAGLQLKYRTETHSKHSATRSCLKAVQ